MAAADGLWRRLDALVDRAPNASDLANQRLQVPAARRLRSLGRPVPPELEREEHLAAVAAAVAPELVKQVRAAADGPLLLLKGPEVAARYPDPSLRPFRDVDLLARDAAAVQRALLAAGFEVLEGKQDELHHQAALVRPGLPLLVEVHNRPKWPEGVEPPPADELLSLAVPAQVGVEGVSTLPPSHHAVLLAAHAWAHAPLRRILDLVDVAAMLEAGDRTEADAAAERWGIAGVWRTTVAALDALFYAGPVPWTLRTWGRNLPAARERTVFESHLADWTSAFCTDPPGRALRLAFGAVARDARPGSGETWAAKARRSARAFRHAGIRVSEHDRDG